MERYTYQFESVNRVKIVSVFVCVYVLSLAQLSKEHVYQFGEIYPVKWKTYVFYEFVAWDAKYSILLCVVYSHGEEFQVFGRYYFFFVTNTDTHSQNETWLIDFWELLLFGG